MRCFVCFALLISLVSQHPLQSAQKRTQPEQQQPQPTDQPSASQQRGTQESPLIVKVVPAPKTKEEIEQDSKDRDEKASDNRWTIRLAGFLAIIAFGQLLVYGYQSIQLKRTVESAGEQSKAMERHIGEAARSATAMEDIAEKIQEGNKAILRSTLETRLLEKYAFKLPPISFQFPYQKTLGTRCQKLELTLKMPEQ